MTGPTIRNLPDGAGRALEEATRPEGRARLGSLLAEVGRHAALTEEEWAVFVSRDRTPGRPVCLE